MEKPSESRIIIVLTILILILLTLVVYAYAVKPALNAYVIQKQVEAKDFVLESLISNVETNGYVELYQGNESLVLVPYQVPENSFENLEN